MIGDATVYWRWQVVQYFTSPVPGRKGRYVMKWKWLFFIPFVGMMIGFFFMIRHHKKQYISYQGGQKGDEY